MRFQLKLLSSLEKVFLDQEPEHQTELPMSSGFQNEVLSFQTAFCMTEEENRVEFRIEIDSPIAGCVHARQVRCVPVSLAVYSYPAKPDGNYLRTTPGMYPDLLSELKPASLFALPERWGSIWYTVTPDANTQPGVYPIHLSLIHCKTGEVLCECEQKVEILPGILPEQKLIHTKWFYCDCLANYYNVPAFSEEHWRIVENFVRRAVQGGINMILTPIHTPPINTAIGGERLTTQLVDITVENGRYVFDMTSLRRWIDMCKRCGVKYYEIAHLFTQWGAKHAPKIIAKVNGEEKRIFGWETDSRSEEYREFLEAYLPAVNQVFLGEGVAENVRWHISDEPEDHNLEFYLAGKELVQRILPEAVVIDALRDVQFYKRGVIQHPVAGLREVKDFLEAKVPELWVYYCCCEYIKVPNLLIAMPSARNRILGALLFKHQIEGFLQWGYNFYNNCHSEYAIDPYFTTDADGQYPAGDSFQVYPGEDGQPVDSIRMVVTQEGMYDLRAFEWLAELAGRDYVIRLMEEELSTPLTFYEYPQTQAYLLKLRAKVNAEILKRL